MGDEDVLGNLDWGLENWPRLHEPSEHPVASAEIGRGIVEALTLLAEGKDQTAVFVLLNDLPTHRVILCMLSLIAGYMKRAEDTPARLGLRLARDQEGG